MAKEAAFTKSGVTNRCHKSNFFKVKEKGTLREKSLEYGQWAYWCKDKQDGWYAHPCDHLVQKGERFVEREIFPEEKLNVKSYNYDNRYEHVIRGNLVDCLAATASFVARNNDITIIAISTIEITPLKWRISIFYSRI
jgi:hypothetical protein